LLVRVDAYVVFLVNSRRPERCEVSDLCLWCMCRVMVVCVDAYTICVEKRERERKARLGVCDRGGYCNFMHMKHVPRHLRSTSHRP